MKFDYECACGVSEERDVLSMDRDYQFCGRCRTRLRRLPHFETLKVNIPAYMRAAHDETKYMPDDAAEREEYLAGCNRSPGVAAHNRQMARGRKRGKQQAAGEARLAAQHGGPH
jgi:hypothetical protein